MHLVVKGRNAEVTGRVQRYAEKRFSKIVKQLDEDLTRFELEIIEEANPRIKDNQVAEATIWTDGTALRAREASHDVFAAIDLVSDKLARQVRKFREKRVKQRHGGPHNHDLSAFKGALQDTGQTASPSNGVNEMTDIENMKIVKTKQFRLGPMTPVEAAEQMSLVGHDFFVFVNAENNQTCVLYKRHDGDLGLIEPTLADVE